LASGVYSVIIWIGKTDPVCLSEPFSAEVRGVIYKRNQLYKIWQQEVLRSLDVGLRIRTKGLDMCRYKIIVTAMFLCILLVMQTQAQSEDKVVVDNNSGTTKIAMTKLDIKDKTFKLSYEIRNDSEHDIWVCENVEVDGEWDFEAYLADDNQTLAIRRRLDVWANLESYRQRVGMYVRLRAGEDRTGSLSLTVPVHPRNVYEAGRPANGLEYATRLAIEISYYVGDLPGNIRGILEKVEKTSNTSLDKKMAMIKRCLGDTQYFFNELNKDLNLTEKIFIPYNWQALKGEHILRITVDGLLIPYEEKWPKPSPPDLSRCTRVEIQYLPSMLEYFFPYKGQQKLLSPAEKEYLQSLKTVVVEDQKHLKDLTHEVSSLSFIGTKRGTITSPRMANIACYRDDKRLTSFTIYLSEWSASFMRTEEMNRFRCTGGLRSLNILTLQIQPFELRVKCADKLSTLQIRLDSLYSSKRKYPVSKWCDATVRALSRDYHQEYIVNLFKCPNVHEGKCHYALNSNCTPNSPPDMIILFETKAGWNQNGGPELFIFDNHDPKGGCVLLNDGTVKFIRTKEELQQLRWK